MTAPYLTMAEIEPRYPNEWVLLARPSIDHRNRVAGGHVLFHTPDRLEIDRRMLTLPDAECAPRMACVYTGEPVFPDLWDRPEFLEEGDELRRAQ